ncbi:hypothetical protein [Jiangella sp. DSM 45060]|uniref:hypothetical protein n=1 Tax=Jiangella sp. DSM 45060 TaxID=1798224 RepID=UPI00087D845F|nr:hypothetical protein [Jiangella sp. DSM 45060]SDS92157.1 hypothetical protein SAMN04515669_2286 [Jiangella sp. DSM 45060]
MTDPQAGTRNPGAQRRPALSRRIWDAIVRKFPPPPMPRPRPSEEQLAEGHLTVGVIDYAIEDAPGGDVQGPDTLLISAEVPGHGVLHRRVQCPLSMPGSGRGLAGQTIGLRHTTFDPDFVDDVLVVRWPPGVDRALEPFRFEGPGALRARVWSFLAGCSFVVMWIGIALTPILLCGMIFGGDMFTDLPTWFHPGIALAASVAAVPLGFVMVAVCNGRMAAALSHPARQDGR